MPAWKRLVVPLAASVGLVLSCAVWAWIDSGDLGSPVDVPVGSAPVAPAAGDAGEVARAILPRLPAKRASTVKGTGTARSAKPAAEKARGASSRRVATRRHVLREPKEPRGPKGPRGAKGIVGKQAPRTMPREAMDRFRSAQSQRAARLRGGGGAAARVPSRPSTAPSPYEVTAPGRGAGTSGARGARGLEGAGAPVGEESGPFGAAGRGVPGFPAAGIVGGGPVRSQLPPPDAESLPLVAFLGGPTVPLADGEIGFEFFGDEGALSSGEVETDAAGAFRVPFPVAAREDARRLKLTFEGAVEAVIDLGPRRGRQDVVFQPFSGKKTGTLLDLEGHPVPHAKVRLLAENPAERSTRTTDRRGVFAIDGWPGGSQRLEIEYQGHRGTVRKSAKVELRGKRTREQHVTLHIDTGASLVLNVRDTSGNSLEHASLWARVKHPGEASDWQGLGDAGHGGFPRTEVDEEGQVYLADLPVSGILEVAGWGSTIDPESDESRELEERNPSAYLDQVHSLHGTLRFALEEIRSTRALNLFLEPARRIELHVVDEFNRSVREVIAARDLLSVKGAAAGEFRQFVLGRNRFATPGVYDLKVAPDIEQEVAILTPRGGAFLKPDALRRAVAHTAHVERTDFITGEVKRRRGLPGLEDVRVVLELDGAPSRSFTTGSGGFFCIHVPRGKRPKTLVVEIDSQNTVTRRRPVRGEFYEIVPED